MLLVVDGSVSVGNKYVGNGCGTAASPRLVRHTIKCMAITNSVSFITAASATTPTRLTDAYSASISYAKPRRGQ
jgi:hypothetical protein